MRRLSALAVAVLLASSIQAKDVRIVATKNLQESFVIDPIDPLSDVAAPELDAAGESCGGIGIDFCGARCEMKTTGSMILVSTSCEETDNPMQFHCSCTWIMPGPYMPPCYWNCSQPGGRNAF